MGILEFFDSFSAGSFVAFVVLVLSCIEIAPIKVSPLLWIGKRLNKEAIDKVNTIEKKLDEHIAQDYRTKIMHFQSTLIFGGISGHTMEEWKEVIKACSNYETYCIENKIDNGYCVEAISFIRKSYQQCLKDGTFTTFKEE